MLVYLDIDGVMVPANSWKRPEILEDGFPNFSPMAIKALNRIISNSRADIVLTTSHKSKYSINQWKTIFKRRNINFNKIRKLPENREHLNRKDELLKWFTDSRMNNHFIIIDDDKSLNSLPSVLKKRLVQTSGGIGLTDYLADEAINTIENSKHVTV
jgi:hypothetical protein